MSRVKGGNNQSEFHRFFSKTGLHVMAQIFPLAIK